MGKKDIFPALESGRIIFERKSLFKNAPNRIQFGIQKQRELWDCSKIERCVLDGFNTQPYFYLNPRLNYTSVRQSFLRAGWKRIRPENDGMISIKDWQVFWGRAIKKNIYGHLNDFQRVNHFVGNAAIGRKDRLEDTVGGLGVMPKTYSMPNDREQLIRDQSEYGGKKKYIVKPENGSCGRNIYVIPSGIEHIPENDGVIVQEYIDNPHLIEGLKYDLRLYVVVPSFNPLRIYLYPDGLTRFATELYDVNAYQDVFSHLTNYSVNKYSKKFIKNTNIDQSDVGSKWSWIALKKYLGSKEGIGNVWAEVNDIIVKTLIATHPYVMEQDQNFDTEKHSFEFYGFDIMLDENLRPHLIEVNTLPSLGIPTPLDRGIKMDALSDCFSLLGLYAYDRSKYDVERERCFDYLPKSGFTQDTMGFSREELQLFQQFEDEKDRKGRYELIYPPPNGDISKYDALWQRNKEKFPNLNHPKPDWNQSLSQWSTLTQTDNTALSKLQQF